jgi:hypothetical protein
MELLKEVFQLGGDAFAWAADLVARHPVPATVITLFSVAMGAWSSHKNRVATIFGHSMQAITHLDSRWESADLRESKRRAALFLQRYLRQKSCGADPAGESKAEEVALTAVLNFLEAVGCFVKSGAIGHRIAWQLFGSAAQLYVEAASAQLAQYRTPHETVYSELHFLYLVARVEEQRRDGPMSWVWRRTSAMSLTWQTSASSFGEWLSLFGCMLYGFATGRIQRSCRLPPLFSEEELLSTLSRDAQPEFALQGRSNTVCPLLASRMDERSKLEGLCALGLCGESALLVAGARLESVEESQ